jgi:transposase-like protein
MGVRQRRGKVRAKVVPNVHGDTVREVIRENVERGEKPFTDACGAYRTGGMEPQTC